MSAGMSSCALLRTSEGNVTQCWGGNQWGNLGLGDKIDRYTPTTVTALGTQVVQITLGSTFACAILMDVTTKCRGENYGVSLGLATQSTA